VSYAAIAALVTGRGWVIATAAALLGAVGAFAGALYNVLVGINLAAAASAHMSQGAAARFLVTSFGSGPAHVAEYVYFAGEYSAPVVMGFALWRSRRDGAARTVDLAGRRTPQPPSVRNDAPPLCALATARRAPLLASGNL
jgi:hypothetical protein